MRSPVWLPLFGSACFSAMYYPVLVGLRLFIHDSFIWSGSFLMMARAFRGGEFPWWDPFHAGGMPFYPNLQLLGLLDPLSLILLVIQGFNGADPFGAYRILHFLRLGIFCWGGYRCLRELELTPKAAMISVLLFLFCVGPVSFYQNGGLNSFYLNPLCLFFLVRAFKTQNAGLAWRDWLGGAVCLGVSLNIYIPSYTLFHLIVATATLFVLKPAKLTTLRPSKQIAIPCLVLLCLSAPPLVSYFELTSKNAELYPFIRLEQKRALGVQTPQEIENQAVFSEELRGNKNVFISTGNVVGFLFPDFWRMRFKPDDRFQAKDRYAEYPLYIGLLPLLLAIYGLIRGKRSVRLLITSNLLFLGVVMINFQGVHLAEKSPILRGLESVLPFLKLINVSENFAWMFMFYICSSVGLGVDALASYGFNDSKRNSAGTLAITAFSILLVIKVLVSMLWFEDLFLTSLDLTIWTASALALAILWVSQKVRKWNQPALFFAVLVGVTDVIIFSNDLGRNVVWKSWISREVKNVVSAPFSEEELKRERKVVSNAQATAGWLVPLAFPGVLTGRREAFPGERNHVIFTTRSYFQLLTQFSAEHVSRVSGVHDDLMSLVSTQGSREKPRILRARLNSWEIEASARQGDFLVVADGWSRHWNALVNGRSAPIEKVNGNFKSISLVEGLNRIELKYQPRPFQWAVGAYLFGLLLVFLVLIREVVLRRWS